MVERVLLASPRGYCAGVERAVETVELALDHYGPPVYVRKQIVHNIHVVRDLEARGAIFVDSESEAPEGATIVYSAHGVAPAVNAASAELGHNVIDATCPLVTKVHVQARRYAADGYTVILIGHAGHEEVVGTMGEAPEATVLVQDVAEAEALDLPADARLAYITQTTLSVDETSEIISVLRRRFPAIHAPKKEDICYATSNRQWAVKEMLTEVDLLLVIGSRNSSNSNRLVDVARAGGVASYLIDDETEIDDAWLEGVATVGVTSGASAPEKLVNRVCDWFRARGVERIEPFRMVDEDVTFRLPVELRRELALAETQSSGTKPLEQGADPVARAQERGQPLGLALVDRDRRLCDAALVPDAEADMALLGVARDPERLAGLGARTAEELDELRTLRRGTPGAVAKRLADRPAALPARVHRASSSGAYYPPGAADNPARPSRSAVARRRRSRARRRGLPP